MKTNRFLIVGLAFAIGLAVVAMIAANRKTQPMPVSHPAAAMSPAVVQPTPSAVAPTTATKPEEQPPKTAAPPQATPPKPLTLAAQTAETSVPLTVNGYVVQDPVARVALSFVGAEPDATQYWIGAINDPSMPPEERKDLIEDLNEDGLSDPNNPGLQDAPLIVSRIQLIERLTPYETDPVNIDALAEAYKDLNNMLAGRPVQ